MFGLFKKSKKKKSPQLVDLNDYPIEVGDFVISKRYDLGKCELIEEDGDFYYQSLDSGERINWLRMIDAATEKQKVEKIISKED